MLTTWLDLAPDVASRLADALGEVTTLELGRTGSGLVTVTASAEGVSVIIGHPLWGETDETLAAEQISAFAEVRRLGYQPVALDVRTLMRSPASLLKKLGS